MRIFFSTDQLEHRPQQYMVAGRLIAPFEIGDRAAALARTLSAAGHEVIDPPDAGMAAIHAVHPAHFTTFLQTAYERFQALPNAGPEAIPNVHPHASAAPDYRVRAPARPTGIIGQLGYYVGDLSSPIGAGTWTGAYASAQAAIAAAACVRDGTAREAMALCRPPGHHAYADRVSGFCFLNNAAIAAEILRARYANVAILDFDTHHGDGTQAIFYARGDVFVGSHHTDPSDYYPHFTGYADELGVGAGAGSNRNIPIPPGSGDTDFIAATEQLIASALAFGAEAIVVSAGWDAHADDPLSKLTVSDDAFASLGRLYGELPVPIVIIQEGGYSLSAIERVAPLFVQHFMAERLAN